MSINVPQAVELNGNNFVKPLDRFAIAQLGSNPTALKEAREKQADQLANLAESIGKTLVKYGYDANGKCDAQKLMAMDPNAQSTARLLEKALRAIQAAPAPRQEFTAGGQADHRNYVWPAALETSVLAADALAVGPEPVAAPVAAETAAAAPVPAEGNGKVDVAAKMPSTLAPLVDGKLTGPDRSQLQLLAAMPGDARTALLNGNKGKFGSLAASIEGLDPANVTLDVDKKLLAQVVAEIRKTVLKGETSQVIAAETAPAVAPKPLAIRVPKVTPDSLAADPKFANAEAGKVCTADSCPAGTKLVSLGANVYLRDPADSSKTVGSLGKGEKVVATGDFIPLPTEDGGKALYAKVTLPGKTEPVFVSAAYLKKADAASATA